MSRSTIIVLLCLLSFSGYSEGLREQTFSYGSSWTLSEFAKNNGVPLKKAAEVLAKDAVRDARTTLSDLGVDEKTAWKNLQEYRKTELLFVRSIAGTGMLIVFTSLIVVSVIVGLLQRLHTGDKKGLSLKSDKTSGRSTAGTHRPPGDMSNYAIAAAVAAIFLHEEEVEEENRLLLTWKRASTTMWKSSLTMPNEAFDNMQGGWK